jgi:malonate transporter
MLDILAITSPIYLAILIGFFTTRQGLFDKAAMRALGAFVVRLALPALVFKSLALRQFGDIMNVTYLLAYAGSSLAMLAAGYLSARRLGGMDRSGSAVYGMGMCCSNSGFVGYPIVLLTFAPVAGVALALNMIVENALMIPLALALAERGRGAAGPWPRLLARSLWQTARNPIVIAVGAGLAVSLLRLDLPGPALRTMDLFAMASSGVSLLVIGGTLAGLHIGPLARRAAPIVAAKLAGHPAAVWVGMALLPLLGLPALDPALAMAGVLMAAMPMLSIYPILAQAYGEEDLSATVLLLATIASFFTLSALLWLLRGI